MRNGLCACFVFVAWFGVSLQAQAQVIYSWTSAVNGNYNDNTGKWTPAGPPATGDTATINVTGTAYTVTLNDSRTVGTFNLSSTDATLSLNSGGVFQATNGNITGGVFLLNNGTIQGGTWNVTTGVLRTANFTTSSALDGVNLTGTIDMTTNGNGRLMIKGGTDFGSGSAISMGNTATSIVGFNQAGTINNLSFNMTGNNSQLSVEQGSTLTLGTGTTVSIAEATSRIGTNIIGGGSSVGSLVNNGMIQLTSASGGLNFNPNGNVTNNGTIQSTGNAAQISINNVANFTNSATGLVKASGAGSVRLAVTSGGAITNNGTFEADTNGFIEIYSNLTTAQLGNWNSHGGAGIVAMGNSTTGFPVKLDNTAATLNLTAARGYLTLGTTFQSITNTGLQGGTVLSDGSATARLRSTTGGGGFIINGVTLGDATNKNVLDLSPSNSRVFITGGSTFQNGASLTLGTQSVLGADQAITGVAITLTGSVNAGFGAKLVADNAGTLTLGAGTTVSLSGTGVIAEITSGGLLGVSNNGNVINSNGATISVTGSASNLQIHPNGSGATGNFTNNGSLQASGGSTLTISSTTFTNGSTGTMTVSGASSQIRITTNAWINQGNISNTQTLSLNSGSGTVTNQNIITNNGTIQGSVINASGSLLNGTGIISGSVNIQGGGVIKPGNSPGSITVQSGITITGEYDWQLGSNTTSGAGSNFSQIVVSAGNLFIDPTLGRLGILLSTPNGTLDPFWATNQQWMIINNTGTGTANAAFSPSQIINGIEPNGFFTTSLGGTNNNDIFLNWTAVAVPEPATWAMIILSSAGLLFGLYTYRRRIQLLFNTEVDAELDLDNE